MTGRLFKNRFSMVVLCLFAGAAAPVFADDWKPIDPAHLAMKAPTVEKDADAEVIFWEVRVQDEVDGYDIRSVERHYLRIKVFTERGKESQSTVEIPYRGTGRISEIAGRTIKSDGTIIELKKDAVFDRTIVKSGDRKVKVKSFAMPAVEPGCIIEYRWKETRDIAFYMRVHFQRSIPIQVVKYYLKPLSLPGLPYGMRTMSFRVSFDKFVKEKDGFYSVQQTNVPAFHEEPRMPPEDQVRSWMLVYYSKDRKVAPAEFWQQYGKEVYEQFKGEMKPNDEVRKTAAEIVGDASTPDQKLDRLYEFCRTKMKNVNDDANGMTPDDRAKLKENKSPADTLKRGMGTGKDLNMLFGAFASALGFDARVANLADRSDIFFDVNIPDDYFLQFYIVAVKVGEGWHFYDASKPYVSPGMLQWQYEGQEALISDSKKPTFVMTPLTEPEKSLQRRTAKLVLSEDGTIEGDVRIEYTGHAGAERKEYDDDDSPTQREETLRNGIKRRMSTAELSNIKIENVTDRVKPFVYSFHVRVPGYGQRTGKRLFLQPEFFERGIEPLFPTSERKHAVYFHYGWSEDDTVEISLPAGFALDNADAPEGFTASRVSKYDVHIGLTDDKKTLIYQRKFFFGANGNLVFPQTSYPQLKMIFDVVHERDNHTITLKQGQ
ncbi:MAG TPA: DUF3857 domain-containing protein [Blastocatellia bacterium]|nr:DUF3857 domain-containing protein [Blastocatellia bacterium]